MNIKKPLVIAGVIGTVGAASLIGTSFASAAANSTSNGSSNLVDKIASTFNLNKEDVQKVFDQEKSDQQAEVRTRLETKLSQAVTDGKLTEDQKAKILAKFDELVAKRTSLQDAFKDKTDEERKQMIDQERADLKQWMTDNNIPEAYMRAVMGPVMRGDPGGPNGMGGPGHMGNFEGGPDAGTQTDTPDTGSTQTN